MISNCCKAEIIKQLLWGDYYIDQCAICSRQMLYAFVSENEYQANGVCKLHDDELYFFTQITSKWESGKELLNMGYTYVGQAVSVIDTVGIRYDTQGIDLLDMSKHIHFSNEWEPKVLNPHFAMRKRESKQ